MAIRAFDFAVAKHIAASLTLSLLRHTVADIVPIGSGGFRFGITSSETLTSR